MKQEIKFCVDESVDFPVVLYLRKNGFDTISISENCPSLEDTKILDMAFEENRIIITNDKDFGDLIFKQNLKSAGIILLRLHDQSSQVKIKALDIVIKNYLNKLTGNFVVVTMSGTRIRKVH